MKKIFSYLFPVTIRKITTQYNGTVSVVWQDGKKMLNTAISNYSYGSLQRILKKALLKLPFDPSVRQVLVLGMGAGSIVETIRNDFKSNAHRTLVEIDADIVAIAKQEFGIDAFENISIHTADAVRFIHENKQQFDLVIADLFVIDEIPEDCTGAVFIHQLAASIAAGGKLVYNTIIDTMDADKLQLLVNELEKNNLTFRVMKKVAGSNNIILAHK